MLYEQISEVSLFRAVQFDRPQYTKTLVNNKFPCDSVFVWSVLRIRASISVNNGERTDYYHRQRVPIIQPSLNVSVVSSENKPTGALQRV